MSAPATAGEVMTINAARQLRDGQVCLVGVGPPNAAVNLARRLHAPGCVLVYESGAIGSKPRRLPLSIGDDELAATADEIVSVPEMFNYWVGAGRIDVGFLGAAQIDRHGSINTTVIGEYDSPKVRLPGAGGAPEIAAASKQVMVLLSHSRRTLVERLDFTTSTSSPWARDGTLREPMVVITDLGVLRQDADGELGLIAVHEGVEIDRVRESTGWALRVADEPETTPPVTAKELETLRGLRSLEASPGGGSR
jgi:glutaconate CoA-transferase, subunit B